MIFQFDINTCGFCVHTVSSKGGIIRIMAGIAGLAITPHPNVRYDLTQPVLIPKAETKQKH